MTAGVWGLAALGAFSVLGTIAFLALVVCDIERHLRNLPEFYGPEDLSD
jgi:hypothetical protein